MRQLYVCLFHDLPDQQVQAVVTAIGRGNRESTTFMRGVDATLDGAVGKAIGLPRIRFASGEDELEAERAALRTRAVTLMARDGQLCSLGFA